MARSGIFGRIDDLFLLRIVTAVLWTLFISKHIVSCLGYELPQVDQFNVTNSELTEEFVRKFFQLIGTHVNISEQQLNKFLIVNTQSHAKNDIEQCLVNKSLDCITNQCVTGSELLSLYSVSQLDSSIDVAEFSTLSPALLYRLFNPRCRHNNTEKMVPRRHAPTASEAWGYGFLFVTIINICALAGAFIIPFMKKSFYKILLLFMVALAVGTLCGNGVIFLIPEAFGLTAEGGQEYVWKSLAVVGGIYLFFIIERVLKIIMSVKDKYKHANSDQTGNEVATYDIDNIICSIQAKTPVDANAKLKDMPTLHLSATTCSTTQILDETDSLQSLEDVSNGNVKTENGYANKKPEKKEIASFAWMIIFGDAFHNFIDGLSIGAAFTESVLAGVSVSVAVICEELPHELGDLAILLNAGMSLKKALMYNFLSACSCYLGLIIGTILGSSTASHDWIFAIAGGMFLYISLVDMVPEMNSAAELEENVKQIGHAKMFFVQNLGILTGFLIMVLMALYGESIKFDS